MTENFEQLEAVFYTSPIPHNLGILTFIGLVFDRIHFPNVYLPLDGFDPDEVANEIKRIESYGHRDYDTWLLTNLMKYALTPELRDFCHFTGEHGQVFGGEKIKEAKNLVVTLEEAIHGPPKPGFHPIYTPGHHKAFNEDQYIDYPGNYYYQCNALLYSAKHGIPLINANHSLPVPGIGAEPAKNNAKLLAAIMAMECVNLVMPEIGELQPPQILEARDDLSKHIAPFRISLLRLAKELNSSIEKSSSNEEVVEAAQFIATTEVYPSLLELKNELAKPKKGWRTRSWDLTKKIPSLAASYATLNLEKASQDTVSALGDWLVAGFSEEKPCSNYYYLLKLEDIGKGKHNK